MYARRAASESLAFVRHASDGGEEGKYGALYSGSPNGSKICRRGGVDGFSAPFLHASLTIISRLLHRGQTVLNAAAEAKMIEAHQLRRKSIIATC